MLRLQDTARAHRLVEQELCQRVGIACEKPPPKDDVSVDFTSDVSLDDQTDSQPALPYKSNLISMQVAQPVSNGLRTNTSKVPSFDLNFSSPSLTHLTLAQLKGECKERNLPRVGSKMQLMRLLNPYRHEILAKYFPDYVVPNDEEIKTDLNESCQPSSHHDIIQTKAFFQNPDSCLQQELGLQQTLMVNHEQQLMRVNFQDFESSLLPHTKPLGMCTSVFSSGSNLPKDVQVYSDMVIGTNCSNVLIAQPCVPLRHSVSAPFFSEVASNSSSTHTTHFQIPSTQATTLIPVTFLDSSVSESDRDAQIPVSSVGGLQLAGTTAKQSFVCMTPNSYLDAQVSNAEFCSNSGNSLFHPLVVTSHVYESNYVTSNQNFPMSNSIDSCLSSCNNETRNAHVIPAQSSSDNQTPVYSQLNASGSPQLTTLHQIEEMWLRIRQLRRNIAQLKTSQGVLNDTENSSNSGNLAHLQQEHNRLAVLCRLLIIERLDTLDEINADDSKNSHESNSSDFKIERDLLNSYLRRLGGSTLANSISSSNTESASFNTSSSLPVKSISNTPCYVPSTTTTTTLPMQQQQQQQHSTVGHSDSYPMTPESRYDDHGNNELAKVTACNDFNENNGEGINSDHTEILFNCGQLNAGKQNSSDSQSSPVSRLLKTHTYDDAPLEQLPSPMTTDLLFELWNSVVEDNNADQWKTNMTDSSDVNMTEEVSQRNNGLSSSDPILLTCGTPTNNSASTPTTAVTNNSRDSSGFNSFSKSDIQNKSLQNSDIVNFTEDLCHTVRNSTGHCCGTEKYGSLSTVSVSPSMVTVHCGRDYSTANGVHMSVQSSNNLYIPVVKHQQANNLSSSIPSNQNFLLHPAFYSQKSAHHSNASVSNSLNGELNSSSHSHPPVWCGLAAPPAAAGGSSVANISNGSFDLPKNTPPTPASTNKQDSLSHYSELLSVCSINSDSVSQTSYTPATELTDTLFGSFDDSGLVELMDTTDSSSVGSFPVSLSLNWSIGT
ncbi:unnamed protein product [Trichobilharzia szidati]|nr:unnamed protein product [Trichobilharzia szidati]